MTDMPSTEGSKDARRLPPDHLYKYRSMTADTLKYTRDIVVESELYFAAPAAFNDPFDQQPAVSVESTPEERERYYRSELEAHYPGATSDEREMEFQRRFGWTEEERLTDARRAFLDTNDKGSLCSLSAKNDSVLMWSHYAANHTGICLRFKTHDEEMFGCATEVRYRRERPLINRIKIATAPKLDLTIYTDALITKADFWSYEQEWRILRTAPADAVPFFPEDLDAIILGARITAESVATLTKWIREREPHPLKLFKAVPRHDTFRLDIVPL